MKNPIFILSFVFLVLLNIQTENTYCKSLQNFEDARKSALLFTPEKIGNAISFYEQILKKNSNDVLANAGLAEAYSILGLYKQEIKENYETEFNLSHSYIKKALSLDKNDKNVQTALGYIYINLSREKEALRVANNLLEKYPDDIDSLYIAWAAEGKRVEDQRIQTVLKNEPKLILAHIDLAKTYFFMKRRYGSAAEQVKNAIKVKDSPYLRNLLGNIYRTKHSISDSINEYKKALRINPKFAPALMNHGISLYYNGNTEESLRQLQKSISINPRFPDAYYYLAANYQRKGENYLAVENYKKFIQMAAGQNSYIILLNRANENLMRISKK